jgi:hypothetical protein
MLPLLTDIILRFLIRSANTTSQPDLDRLSVILFTRRIPNPGCTLLLRPLFQSPVLQLQRKNTTLYPPQIRLHPRHTRLFLFLEMQSESVLAAVMTRLSGCITALGLAAQKAMVPSITSMPILSCSAMGVNELQQVRFTASFVAKISPSKLRHRIQGAQEAVAQV